MARKRTGELTILTRITSLLDILSGGVLTEQVAYAFYTPMTNIIGSLMLCPGVCCSFSFSGRGSMTVVSSEQSSDDVIDARPVLSVSSQTPWDEAVEFRNKMFDAISGVYDERRIKALIRKSDPVHIGGMSQSYKTYATES